MSNPASLPAPSLPVPREKLAGCVWLPRIIAKARLLKAGKLPAEYVDRFCHPGGVDGQFLAFFALAKDQIVTAAELNDAQVAQWLINLPSGGAQRIGEWNHIAENLGRPGFPMAERFPIALSTTYRHLAGKNLTTVFEVLTADEAVTG